MFDTEQAWHGIESKEKKWLKSLEIKAGQNRSLICVNHELTKSKTIMIIFVWELGINVASCGKGKS